MKLYVNVMSNQLPVKKSKSDNRDFIWEDNIKTKNKLPKQFSHIEDLQPVRDQGLQGTCYAQSAACMKEWQEKKDYGLDEYLSPQFFYNQRDYWNNGEQDGEDENEDYGMTGRDVMKILQKVGICKESEYPYGTIEKAHEISDKIFVSASKHCIKNYARVYTLKGLKSSLVNNGPCLIAFPVYNHGLEMWKKRDEEDEMMGGHAMVVVGYDDNEQIFIIRNSWSKKWGINGYCHYKYEDWGSHWECWTTIDEETKLEEPEPEAEEDSEPEQKPEPEPEQEPESEPEQEPESEEDPESEEELNPVPEPNNNEDEYVVVEKDDDCFAWIKEVLKNFGKKK